ncbi:MAG: hypothetical protein ACI8TL_002085, partial [Natronomonas sp.]
MRVECNLYGPVEKTLGQRHVTVEVAGDATVGDVLDVLVERAPDLEEVL